jgi:hypothetical protein
MRKGPSLRRRTRAFAGLLAAWMTVFAMAEVVHHHGLLPPSQDASFTQPSQGASTRDVICLACLASHVPVPAAGAHISLPVPQDTESTVSDSKGTSPRCTLFAVLPSRAPPVHSSQA